MKTLKPHTIKFSREWAMPCADTFSIKPISDLLDRWLKRDTRIVDPFARNSKRGSITNDLDPNTKAIYHEDALIFSQRVLGSIDVVLFDPPYSPRQISECYKGIGRTVSTKDTQNANLYKGVKDALHPKIAIGGLAICCGWNSVGFGNGRGYILEEVLLVCHGGAHNDTIVLVERKT